MQTAWQLFFKQPLKLEIEQWREQNMVPLRSELDEEDMEFLINNGAENIQRIENYSESDFGE